MTKEQAIAILEQRETCRECVVNSMDCHACDEAFEMAIKALEQSTTQEILSHIETGITATGQSDSYCVGFCNALIWLKACITHEEPQFFEDGKVSENSIGSD